MYGLNVVALTGNVASVIFAETKERQDEACSFTLAIQRNKEHVTWARVNVYGSTLVDVCRERLKKGEKIAVQGELMNRKVAGEGESFLTEIRCQSIKFIY